MQIFISGWILLYSIVLHFVSPFCSVYSIFEICDNFYFQFQVFSILFYFTQFYSILFFLFYYILFRSIIFYSILSILSILFYSVLFLSILFYSVLLYCILFYFVLSVLLFSLCCLLLSFIEFFAVFFLVRPFCSVLLAALYPPPPSATLSKTSEHIFRGKVKLSVALCGMV